MIGFGLMAVAPAFAGDLPVEPTPLRRSPGLSVATGVGLTLGALGTAGMLVSAPDLLANDCFECFVAFVVLPPSSVALGVGTALAVGSTLAQAHRIGATRDLALGGAVLLGAGGVLGGIGGITGNLELAVFGGGGLAVTGLILTAAQGAENRRHDRSKVTLVPRIGRDVGLTVGIVW